MKTSKIITVIGFVLLGASFYYFGLRELRAQSVTVTSADAAHIACKAPLDYANSNGYTESYARPNVCHQKRVFYNYGGYFSMGNCGAGPWCAWRVRCPAGASVKTHNSGGGWHYPMSPNIDGMYDGPAHNFCVDANGNQVDPIPGESEANPEHTHSINVTRVSVAKAQIVDTNQSYYYTYRPDRIGLSSNWVDCPGGASGPYSGGSSSSSDIEYGNFANHFHCKNTQQNLTNATDADDNPEALPVALAAQPSSTIVGSGFSTQSDISGILKDAFIDKPSFMVAPLGTVLCLHSNSDKVYFSTVGTCPPASQFPPKAPTLAISSVSGSSSIGSTTIAWMTNVPADSVVEHGSSVSLGYTTSSAALVTNHAIKLSVGLTYGMPYYYRVKSRDSSGNTVASEIQTLLIPVPSVACTDSDNGQNYLTKGTSTGIYAGSSIDYHAIFGQEPNPTTPRPTANNYSTYIDHCATATQLNEGFCDALGRVGAFGYPCPNGCQNGACVAAYIAPLATAATDASPIGWWKFDGNGNNEVSGGPAAQIVGSASFKSNGGKLNGYGYIPTGSDYFKVPYDARFDLPDSFTVLFWFRQRTNQSFSQNLIYKGSPPNNFNFNISRWLWNEYNQGPVIAGHTAANTGYWTQPSNPNQLAHNEWHHVAFTKSPNYHAYYLDGVLIGSKDVSPSSSYASDYGGPAKTPHNDIIIGDTAVDTDIDDLKIWNRSLTDNEVRQEGGFPPPVPPAAPSGPAANAIGTSTDSTIGATAWTMTGTTTATSTTIPSQNTQPPSEQQPAMPLPPQVSAPAEPPLQMCGQAITRAYRPSSGECRDFPNTCIPAGWIAQPCEIKVTPLAPLAPPPPAFSARQCKQHLASIRGGLIADRQFWKDVNNQLKNASKDYADRASVSELLKEAKELTAALDKMAKRGVCTSDLLEELDDHQQRLRSEVFAELSVYLSEMQEAAGLQRCIGNLEVRLKELRALAKKNSDEAGDVEMQELEASLKAKIQEIEENRGNFEYDAASECNEFHDVFQSEIAPLRRAADADLNRIVDEVVEGKLAPVRSILEAQLEASGRKIDDLLIKVAEVHKAIEGVSRSASAISEKIAVSYTAMAKIEEKFTKERSEMQSAKERLIPLVEAAVQAIKEKRCVVGGQREALIQEFGTVASVNWFSEKADELEKRLNIFIASCQSKDVAKSDVEAFRASVARTEEANQQVSFEKGLTPFKDVPTHEWYYGGMLNGYKTGFITQGRPAESVLRQDALLMVLRAAGANGVELTGECFVGPNVSNVSEYARCAVALGLKKGLNVKGSMSEPVKRGEVALWIAQLGLVPEIDEAEARKALAGYDDLTLRVPKEWRSAIARLVYAGTMVGAVSEQSKKWQPFDPLTRAALAVVLEKFLALP